MSFDRLGPNDLTILATDKGQVPMNIGAVLIFEPGPTPRSVRDALALRLAGIRRFRQRLRWTGLLEGAPIWVDDPAFSESRHVGRTAVDDTDAMLDAAAALVCTRLPRDRPQWRVHLLDGFADGSFAVVIVLHHVLADGMGGLAVLGLLAGDEPVAAWHAEPAPTHAQLRRDAHRRRVAAVAAGPATVRSFLAGVREIAAGGGGRVAPSSLLVPTSSSRRARTVNVAVSDVRDAAHRHGATVNDVVIAAVAGALFDILARRGESPPGVVVSVPVAARSEGGELGNQVGATPVAVPNGLDACGRLREITARTQRAKSEQRGSSALVLSWMFRALATFGLGQYFVDRQRLVHTFETNLRGPAEPITLAGGSVRQIVPIAVNPGNVAVSFDVLSYAGVLTVTVVADPVAVPEIEQVVALLAGHLDRLVACPC